MQEVTIRLRFTQPCLGNARRATRSGGTIYALLRGTAPQRSVIFLGSWWRAGLQYASRVLSRYDSHVERINWDQAVDGKVEQWRRYITANGTKTGYALHEGFLRGKTISVNAVLPDGLSVEAMIELLTIMGRYKGISPYQSADTTYGTFDVVSVLPTIRAPAATSQTV